MRAIEVGTELPTGDLLVKFDSAMVFYMDFWEDADSTVATDLTGAVVSIEVTVDGTVTTTWTAANSSNRAIWTLTSTDTDVSWEEATYQVVITKDGDRHTVLAGPVRLQS